jgi:hypothetical protein
MRRMDGQTDGRTDDITISVEHFFFNSLWKNIFPMLNFPS